MNAQTGPYIIGIDGGGSKIRAVVTQADLSPCAEVLGKAANPTSIGYEAAAQIIQGIICQLMEQAQIQPDEIGAVGVGIAGASHTHSATWLRQIISEIIPTAHLELSSDLEIALVGAHGQKHGILLLAGTGSAALGVNSLGTSIQLGGWGYQLGDEGSGYWLGLQAIRHAVRTFDGYYCAQTTLDHSVLDALNLQSTRELIPWLYHSGQSRTSEIASLAPLVLEAAEAGEPAGLRIIAQGVDALSEMTRVLQRRLAEPELPIAFAGGLLTHDNPLSRGVYKRLGLAAIPRSKYDPATGAIILALKTWEQ